MLRPSFVAQCKAALKELAKDTKNGPAILMGTPWTEGGNCTMQWRSSRMGESKPCATSMICRIMACLMKSGCFRRALPPAPLLKGVRIGVPICEDIWTEETCETLAESGAEILLVPNGSPFERTRMMCGSILSSRG